MERLRRLGARWPWFGRVLDVHERVGDVNGGVVASAITVSVFVSLFPLMLVAIAVVGFVAAGDSTVSTRIIDNLGLTGEAADTMQRAIDTATNSRQAASIIGLLGLAWAGSAVATALQQGVQAPWQQRPNGIKDRLFGMVWIVSAGLGFAAVFALGGLLNFLPDEIPKGVVTAAIIVVGLVAELGLFLWMFWGLGDRRVGWRNLVPGAIVAAIGFEILKLIGTVYVPQLVSRTSALYGPLGVVFAILAWLAFFARLIIYSSAFNAVRYESAVGTHVVEVAVPALPGPRPVEATRGGTIVVPEDPDADTAGERDDTAPADAPAAATPSTNGHDDSSTQPPANASNDGTVWAPGSRSPMG